MSHPAQAATAAMTSRRSESTDRPECVRVGGRASYAALISMILNLILRAARRDDLDGLALLAADDRLADRGLVRELLLGRVRLGRADDEVLDRLLRVDVAEADDRRRPRRRSCRPRFVSMTRACEQALLELRDLVLEHRLLVLGVVVLRVLGDVAELTGARGCARRLPGAWSSAGRRAPASASRSPRE